MKRILSLLLAILMTVSVLTSCGNKKDDASGSPDGGSNTENTEPIGDDRSEISIAENVVTYDDAETAKIAESVVSAESTSEGAVLNVKKGTALDELSVNEIFVLSGDKAADFGGLYFAKIKSVEDNGDTISYTVEAPAMDEVFTEVDIDFSKEMTFDNIASIETFDGVTVAPLDENYVESLGMSVGNRPSSFYGSNGEASSMGIDPSFNGKDLKIEYDIDLKKFFESDKGEENEKASADEAKNIKVYYTDTGKCYHKDDCQYLYNSKHETTLDDAVNVRNLRSCTVCKPAIPENASPDWIKTNSALTLSGEVSFYDMAVSVVSENGNMWTLKDGFDNLAIRTQGRLFASAKLDGNFEIELGGKTTEGSALGDWLTAEGLNEKTFPLVYIKYNGANFSVTVGDAAYNNPELLSIGILLYADINGNISASTTFYCEYEKSIVHDFDIFREGKFLGIGAGKKPDNLSSDGRFDWYISAELDADVEFDVIGCSVLLFVGNINIAELSLFKAGVEAEGNLSFYASPTENKFSANGNVCCFVELIELNFRLKTSLKDLIDEEWKGQMGPLVRFDIWEASGGYSTDPESDSVSGGVKYTLSEDGTYYTASGVKEEIDGKVKILSSYYGLPVKEIDYYGFENCTGLTSVTIGRNIETIGAGAFAGCKNLTGVTFVSEGNLKTVFSTVFSKCSSLTEITVPDGVTMLGASAFEYCTSLVSVTLPDSITDMGGSLFNKCTSLEKANIPFGITTVPGETFLYCESLKNVAIPYGITKVEASAFGGCESIPAIKMPDSVIEIEKYAFANCGAKRITLSRNLTKMGEYAFSGCDSLTDIVFPEGLKLTELSSYAFNSCGSLETVVIPDCITNMNVYTFAFCEKLKNVTIGKNIADIGFASFTNCYSLEQVNIMGDLQKIYGEAFKNCENLKTITIPDSVSEIGMCAFWNTGLTEIKLPGNLTVVESNVFYNCESLKKVTIGSKLREIKGIAFEECTALEQIVIPDNSSLEIIGDSAFYNTALKSISLPNSLKEIGNTAFKYADLESIIVPDSVTTLGAGAFEGCMNLKTAVIGKGITKLSASTFEYCTELRSIVLPVGLTSIKFDAIHGCNKLEEIRYNGTSTQWGKITKDYDWNTYTSDYKVVCTNTTLTKSES